MKIFLDESGYTGQDLLNPDQPVFCIATIGIPGEECEDLKARYFGDVRSQELKYSSLVRRPKQQRMVLEFLGNLADHPERVKVSVVHKQFTVLTKMVDLITENAMYLDGVNLYKDGAHIGLSQMLYFGIPAACGTEFFERLLQSFQRAMLDRSWESFTEFRNVLFDDSLSDEQREWLVWFQGPVLKYGYQFFREIGDDEPFELALTCGAYLMGKWRYENRSEPIELIHDQSSNMAGQEHIWEFYMSEERAPFERDYGNDKTSIFPIGLKSTTFADSTEWAGLQLADVVAGAFADGARFATRGCSEGDAYRDKLWHGIVQETPLNTLPIWPNPDPEAMTHFVGTDVNEDLEYATEESIREGLDPRRVRSRKRDR